MPPVELTDIGSVRQFMQKSVSDKLQDEDLEVLIRQLSEEVQRHLNREFLPASTSLRSFEYLPNTTFDLIDLQPYEYRKVVKVVLDPDLTPVTLPATSYRPYPTQSRDGSYFGLRLAELPEPVAPAAFANSPALPFQTRRVDVEAEWGLGTIPAGLQHWCNVAVEAWVHLRRGMIASQQQIDMGEGPVPIIDDLPIAVRRGLRRWERPTIVASA